MKQRITLCIFVLLSLSANAQTVENGRQFEFGFEQRTRNENLNNVFDFNDSLDDELIHVRYRTRAWMKAPFGGKLDLVVGLNQETKQILTPDRPFRFDEAIFETAYLDFKEFLTKGLSLRVGRQNLMRGEGFLLFEGTPGDGSRTMYFNAAVLAYAFKKSKIELMGISNPRTDRYLPRIHDRFRPIYDWNESALGAYYTDGNFDRTSLEAYYFFKRETGDLRPATNPQHQGDRSLSTAGGRIVRKLPDGWSLTGELALQWGRQHPNLTVAGRGGYAYVKRTFGAGGRHYLLGGYIGMSGDDPSTPERIEDWDPLFSRWPKYSELLIYSFSRERASSYWTNLGMWQAEYGWAPHKTVNVRATLYRMNSFHPFRGNPAVFGQGTYRGLLPQVRVDYNPNKYWKTHVIYEYLKPGDFYSARSAGYFLRFEAIFTYSGAIKLNGNRH